jgi:hypothetical protein
MKQSLDVPRTREKAKNSYNLIKFCNSLLHDKLMSESTTIGQNR